MFFLVFNFVKPSLYVDQTIPLHSSKHDLPFPNEILLSDAFVNHFWQLYPKSWMSFASTLLIFCGSHIDDVLDLTCELRYNFVRTLIFFFALPVKPSRRGLPALFQNLWTKDLVTLKYFTISKPLFSAFIGNDSRMTILSFYLPKKKKWIKISLKVKTRKQYAIKYPTYPVYLTSWD